MIFKSSILSGVLFLAVLGLSFAQGISEKVLKSLEKFSKALNLIQNNYADTVDEQKLLDGAINGMMNTLDANSSFLDQETYREFSENIVGQFGGIGIEVTLQQNKLIIIAPIEGGPAQRAGVLPGDQIIQINGEDVEGLSIAEVSEKMRGPLRSSINLTVQREGLSELRDFSLVREIVKIDTIRSELLDGRYASIKISNFHVQVRDEFLREMRLLETQAGGQLQGLILDLRNNPGGSLNSAIELADLFIPEGVIVSTQLKNDRREDRVASGRVVYDKLPVVILINRGSASSSELLTAALQDHKKAYVIGEQSFGKASIQEFFNLGDGTALRLTVAYFYTPKGRKIHGKGVTPDLAISQSPSTLPSSVSASTQAKTQESSIIVESLPIGSKATDLQKEAAIAYLKTLNGVQ